MAAKARRKVTVTYSNDVEGEQELNAADNAASPAQIQIVSLVSGANTITVPTGATAVTITKPTGNAVAITFKGVTGDTGVRLHDTDPDSISLHSSVTSFVLTRPSESVTAVVRIFWS